MATCPRCGVVNRDEATFCKDCGNTLASPPDVSFASVTTANTTLCPKCGAPLGPGAVFCGNCGATVSPTVFAAAPPPPPLPPAAPRHSSPIPLPPDPAMSPLGAPPSGAGRNVMIVLVIAFALGILGGAGYYAYRHYIPHKAKPDVTSDAGIGQPSVAPPAAPVETPVVPPSVPLENPPPAAMESPVTPPSPPPAVTHPAATPTRPRPATTPSSAAPSSPPPAAQAPVSSPQPAEPVSPPPPAAPEPGPAAPPQPETPPVTRPETARPAPPVQPSARPAPVAPVRPAYNGPASGVLVWTGQLDKEGSVTIEGGIASAGSLQGVLPGVPVSIEIDAKDIGMAESPRASNGWKKLTLRSHKKRSGPITIRWKVLN